MIKTRSSENLTIRGDRKQPQVEVVPEICICNNEASPEQKKKHKKPQAQPIISRKQQKNTKSGPCGFLLFTRYDWLSLWFFFCSGDASLLQIHISGTTSTCGFFLSASHMISLPLRRQTGFMPLDKQAVAERAIKLGRGTQAVIGTSSG